MQQATIEGQIAQAESRMMPIELLVAGDNDRTVFDRSALLELASSIAKYGVIEPIIVRPLVDGELYQIVAGERRCRAAHEAGLDQVPVIIRQLDDEEASDLMLAENINRADIDAIDEAASYKKRMERFGYTGAQMAAKVGVTSDRVRSRLRLLELVPEAQQAVRHKRLPIGHAELLGTLDHNRQYVALRMFAQGSSPSLKTFRDLCNTLLAQQSQESLFSFEDQWLQHLNQLNTEPIRDPEISTRTGFKIDVSMPEPHHLREKNIGRVIKAYIRQLEQSGLSRESEVIGTLLEYLVRANWTTI